MDEYQKKVYDYFKQLLEFLKQNMSRYNSLAKNCPKEERKYMVELTKIQCQKMLDYLDGILIKPGFYFYNLGTIETFLKKSCQISEDEINNLLYEFLKSDIDSVHDLDNKLVITLKSIYNFEQCGIDIVDLKKELEKYNKDMWPRIIMKLHPKQYEKILTILNSNNKIILSLKKVYLILKLYLFDKRDLTKEEKQQVKEALKTLQASDSFIEFCLSKKVRKNLKKEHTKDELTSRKKTSFDSFRPTFIPGLNDKEWKDLENRLQSYYKGGPIRSLDILEKIELVTILLQLNYSEEMISKILLENDRQFYQEKITNQALNVHRNARIIYLLMKNAYKNEKMSQNITDCLNKMNNGPEDEKNDWRELTIDLLEEETREYIKELKKLRYDIVRMKLEEQRSFRNSYFDNLQSIYGNTYLLINQIREQYKKSDQNDKIKWKKCIKLLLTRLILEQFGNYDFEVMEAKRLVEKELKTRAKKFDKPSGNMSS